MGVGGHFWDLLKPYAHHHGPGFLVGKRVAVDLSYWIVQHDSAIRARFCRARSPHLRTTFFRAVTLFSKMGAYPVFVVDGKPSELKAQTRMERFLKGSGVDALEFATEALRPKKRNGVFARYVRECVELLELLGMPVLEARSEAEALCAQLNNEGHVDACITADSDAFLFGANCIIKCFQSNSKEPFECYYITDVEIGLGLRRKQMVAIALLVGNDHDSGGVPGFGVDTAVRFVRLFTEEEILDRLSEIGSGICPRFQDNLEATVDILLPSSADGLTTVRSPHCSHCGHPGSKRAHLKLACEYCITYGSQNCIEKPAGFRCNCHSCDRDWKSKEQKKKENWQINVYKKIAEKENFPNKEIIDMYLCDNHGNQNENGGPTIRWNKPNVEGLVDFLVYYQHWEPSYIRQRILPMLSTIFLREMALNPSEILLLNDQYEFHSILRVKIRYGHPYYLVKWKRAGCATDVGLHRFPNEQSETEESESVEVRESVDLLDEPDVPRILIDDGCWYLLTEENMELVQAAFPKVVDKFLEEKRIRESKSKRRKVSRTGIGSVDKLESPKSSTVQLSITQFYRSSKPVSQPKAGVDQGNSSSSGVKSKKRKKVCDDGDRPLPKSVRRRILFG